MRNRLFYLLKSAVIIFLLSGTVLTAFGQQNNVGIGTASPHASAVLDVAAGNKGILIPRIQLQSETDVATISSPATGLLVYNLNTVLSDGAGFYYWTGSKWQHLGGRNGTAGKDGAVIYIDDPATPAPGLGKEGDLYIARAGGQYYQKQASGWVQQGELLNAVKLQGRSMLPDAPVDGQALLWDNSQQAWAPKNLPAVAGYTGDRRKGIEINSNHEVSARYDTAMWNAARLKGTAVSGTAPAGGDLLWFNAGSNEWEPGPPAAVTPAWHLGGNAGTDPATDYIGTADGTDVVLKTNATERMRLRSNGDVTLTPDFKIEGGRVGIGALGADAPQQPLHVKGGVRLEELEALPVAAAGDILLSHGAGDLARSSSLQVKDGNIGIGTDAPGYLLTVKGRAGEDPLQLEGLQDAATGTELPLVVTADGVVKKGQQGVVTPAWRLGGNAGTDPAADYIGTSDGTDVVLKTNATERMRLRSNGDVTLTPDFKIESGRVGIGALGADAPQKPLHVKGGVRLEDLEAIPNNVPVDVMTIDGNGDIHRTFDLVVRDYKVGIGTDDPTHRLTIRPNALGEDPLKVEGLHDATDGTELPLVITADGIVKKGQQEIVTPAWHLGGNTGTDPATDYIGTADGTEVVLKTNATERMRFGANGDVSLTENFRIISGLVGIGRLGAGVVPEALLHVKGGVRLEDLKALPDTVTGEILLSHGAGDLARNSSLQVKDGNVGIGTDAPSNRLTVKAVEDPLKLEGLQDAAAGTELPLVVTADGIVKKGQQEVVTPAWHLGGNAGTDPATDYIGTSDGKDVVLKTNATERMRIGADGKVKLSAAILNNEIRKGYYLGVDESGNLGVIPGIITTCRLQSTQRNETWWHTWYDLTVCGYDVSTMTGTIYARFNAPNHTPIVTTFEISLRNGKFAGMRGDGITVSDLTETTAKIYMSLWGSYTYELKIEGGKIDGRVISSGVGGQCTLFPGTFVPGR